jgi:hypothetical protein
MIDYSYDGGLYAELVHKRNFKEDAEDSYVPLFFINVLEVKAK